MYAVTKQIKDLNTGNIGNGRQIYYYKKGRLGHCTYGLLPIGIGRRLPTYGISQVKFCKCILLFHLWRMHQLQRCQCIEKHRKNASYYEIATTKSLAQTKICGKSDFSFHQPQSSILNVRPVEKVGELRCRH